MKHSHLLSIIAASIALSACVTTGGGITPDKLTRPIRADDKPYIGEKDAAHSQPRLIPKYHTMNVVPEIEIGTARSGHFTKDGAVTMFAAPQSFRPISWDLNSNKLATTATAAMTDARFHSSFGIWTVDENNEPDKKIVDIGKGCVHPYKAAVADFNQDGIDDVYVGCEGNGGWLGFDIDVPEKSSLVLSDGKGGFTISQIGELSFNTIASAADVNGDDYPDILAGDIKGNPKVFFYINQKDGTFKKDTSRIKGNVQPYNIAELFDIDGDGIIDLVLGGPYTNGEILFGDKDGIFGRERIAFPAVAGRSVSFGFIPVTNNGERILYVSLTSDRNSKLGGMHGGEYMARTVQAVNLTTGKSTVAYDYILKTDGDGKKTWAVERGLESGWLPATRNGQKGITPVDAEYKHLFIADGKLVESK